MTTPTESAGLRAAGQGPDTRDRYERALVTCLRLGAYLMGPEAGALPQPEWDAQCARYAEMLREVRALAAECRAELQALEGGQ